MTGDPVNLSNALTSTWGSSTWTPTTTVDTTFHYHYHGCGCSHWLLTTPAHEHDYFQGQHPFSHLVICRTCGDQRQLKGAKRRKGETE